MRTGGARDGRGSSSTPSHFILQKPEISIESYKPVGLKKLYFSYRNQS